MRLIICLIGEKEPIYFEENDVISDETLDEIYQKYCDGWDAFINIETKYSFYCFNARNISLMILNKEHERG